MKQMSMPSLRSGQVLRASKGPTASTSLMSTPLSRRCQALRHAAGTRALVTRGRHPLFLGCHQPAATEPVPSPSVTTTWNAIFSGMNGIGRPTASTRIRFQNRRALRRAGVRPTCLPSYCRSANGRKAAAPKRPNWKLLAQPSCPRSVPASPP
eukprot:473829-Pyramimonas_sp.AAC.1